MHAEHTLLRSAAATLMARDVQDLEASPSNWRNKRKWSPNLEQADGLKVTNLVTDRMFVASNHTSPRRLPVPF
jgi:hypothetical protein